MIHRLLLEVERSEQEDGALGHFRRDDLLADGEQRRAPQLEIDGPREERVLAGDDVVQFDAAFCILSRRRRRRREKNV
jgi:hypothetical protein